MDKTCAECGAVARRLRKQRCDACYMRLYRRGEPEAGARCAACGERRRPVLAVAALAGAPHVLCGNCALVLERTRPRIDALSTLVARIDRERRRRNNQVTVDRRLRPSPAFDPTVD